ncbi:hypothetical protein SAMN05421858_0747 [Haladaptatus litoreus]|uniref:Uncharacterized protein n=1 Tax=Haladaptatus litoreus TaxID=553468 RepID=A0A1N6WJ51_9EURY|nr:hypothetical protein [Haladaptatus litoreus]SIQ90129.1 hypothetical protein SAMN05421858_0747 [Haladaptatus litoreus]
MATKSSTRTSKGRSSTRNTLAIALTILLANMPTLGAFYVAIDTYSAGMGIGFFRYLTTTMSGALIFAVLWTGIVFFAFGPALVESRNGR